MKTIGVIGGSGWSSTLEYYRLLNTYYCEARGAGHAIDLVLRNLDFAIFRQLLEQGRRSDALKMLSDAATDCENAGAEALVFSANGLHCFLDELKSAIRLPVIHIASATAAAVVETGIKKVGLLGTKSTMEHSFYPESLNRVGIEMVIPDESDRVLANKIIFSELVQGNFSIESRNIFLKMMNHLVDKGAEGVILGCTELPLLIKPSDTDILMFPTTEIHCRAAVNFALAQNSK